MQFGLTLDIYALVRIMSYKQLRLMFKARFMICLKDVHVRLKPHYRFLYKKLRLLLRVRFLILP